MAAEEEVGNELDAKDLSAKDSGGNNLKPGDGYGPESTGRNARENPLLSSAWEDEERAKPLGLVITAALLFVLFAAAVLFGGHGTIGPAGQSPGLMGRHWEISFTPCGRTHPAPVSLLTARPEVSAVSLRNAARATPAAWSVIHMTEIWGGVS
jgi:hypothetical protein